MMRFKVQDSVAVGAPVDQPSGMAYVPCPPRPHPHPPVLSSTPGCRSLWRRHFMGTRGASAKMCFFFSRRIFEGPCCVPRLSRVPTPRQIAGAHCPLPGQSTPSSRTPSSKKCPGNTFQGSGQAPFMHPFAKPKPKTTALPPETGGHHSVALDWGLLQPQAGLLFNSKDHPGGGPRQALFCRQTYFELAFSKNLRHVEALFSRLFKAV